MNWPVHVIDSHLHSLPESTNKKQPWIVHFNFHPFDLTINTQKWRTARLWKCHSLCVPLTHTAAQRGSSDPVKADKVLHHAKTETQMERKCRSDARMQVSHLTKATPALSCDLIMLSATNGDVTHTHAYLDILPSCLSVLVVNFPLTSPIWRFHTFCHTGYTQLLWI